LPFSFICKNIVYGNNTLFLQILQFLPILERIFIKADFIPPKFPDRIPNKKSILRLSDSDKYSSRAK